jgi:hypothetical protein
MSTTYWARFTRLAQAVDAMRDAGPDADDAVALELGDACANHIGSHVTLRWHQPDRPAVLGGQARNIKKIVRDDRGDASEVHEYWELTVNPGTVVTL